MGLNCTHVIHYIINKHHIVAISLIEPDHLSLSLSRSVCMLLLIELPQADMTVLLMRCEETL